MKQIITTVALTALVSASTQAADLTVDVENAYKDKTGNVAVVKVTNSGKVLYRMVSISCAFLDASGKAIDVGIENLSDVQPGQVAYGKASVAISEGKVANRVDCRVSGSLK